MDLKAVLAIYLQDCEAGWSMGTFGALAEFHQEPGEELLSDQPQRLRRATARGAIALVVPDGVSALAYETLSAKPDRWSHGVALCLAEEDAAMSGRAAITELGPDGEAIRSEHRDAILFDMGLSVTGPGCRQVDFCVRSADPDLIAILRAAAGRSILDPETPAMGAILQAHPHRVALTRLGRVEVYQPIGGPGTGGISPAGPHTHVLPTLLATGRTHSATVPIAPGLVPCAWLHPANPVSTPLGRDKPFNVGHHDAFQALLAKWGAPDYVAAKRSVRQAVAAGEKPSGFAANGDRVRRAAIRVALRQLDRQATSDDDRDRIRRWRAEFDTGKVAGDPIEGEHA